MHDFGVAPIMDSIAPRQLYARAIGSYCHKALRLALHLGFFLMCLRFEAAALISARPEFGPILIMIVGSSALGLWNARAALFAFTLAVPLLNGLGQTSFLNGAVPPCLVFSALWTGIASKILFTMVIRHYPLTPWRMILRRLSLDSAIDDGQRTNEPLLTAVLAEKVANQRCSNLRAPLIVTEVMVAAVFMSLVGQLWRNRGSTELWAAFFSRPVMAYGDPWYFLTAAFVWMQGIFYFQLLCANIIGPSPTKGSQKDVETIIGPWVRIVFTVYGATMAAFLLIQYAFRVPEGWVGAGFQSPYEDISSFGSVAVAVFIFTAATLSAGSLSKFALYFATCGGFLAMVVASWSRAAWLAASVFLLVVAIFRLSRSWAAAVVLVLLASVALVNVYANSPTWIRNVYLSRLVALERLESPANKDSGRIHLYEKAARMIRAQPLVGHGIGSFYLTSVKYARPNTPDLRAGSPDFAHNVFLQLAAEDGVPISAMFAGLIVWTLWLGLREYYRQRSSTSQYAPDSLLIVGVSLALAAYLQTQITANSLNVYASNQFIFWFLMAAILALSISGYERGSTSRVAAT